MNSLIDLSIDDLSARFSRIETEAMVNVEEQVAALQTALAELTVRLTTIERPVVVEEYKDEVPTTTKATLSSIKVLPEFHGIKDEYASWRSLVTTTMKYIPKTDQQTYLDALLMIKMKIRGPAAAILSNHGTPLNFDAIIDRLDYSYADQRAMYVIEQELIVLQQGRMTVHEFYDKINEKMNMIITKIHMTHKEKLAAEALIENMREKALRTFITGLNNQIGNVLYSSNPKTLAEAYARLQTILSDRERMSFATQYNRNDVVSNNIQRQRVSEVMVNQNNRVDRNSFSAQMKNRTQNQTQNAGNRERFDMQRNPNFTPNFTPNFARNFAPKKESFANSPIPAETSKNEPMDVEASSMNVNIDNKRKFYPSGSNQFSRQHKVQRVNNIENEYDQCEEEFNEIDDTQSEASIFLES